MKIDGFIWLEAIVEKLWRKHHVDLDEVVDIFERSPAFRFVEKGHRPGENVYSAWGRTKEGRYLTVFFVWKQNRKALVVSARDMTRNERRRYESK